MRYRCGLQIFLSTPSGWRATASITEQLYTAMEFLSTPSGWRATDNGVTFWRNGDISIHALRVEGDPAIAKGRCSRSISIHALRVEGDQAFPPSWSTPSGISIHALRVEGDYVVFCVVDLLSCISIHALRVEGDSKNRQSFRLFLRKREKNLPL